MPYFPGLSSFHFVKHPFTKNDNKPRRRNPQPSPFREQLNHHPGRCPLPDAYKIQNMRTYALDHELAHLTRLLNASEKQHKAWRKDVQYMEERILKLRARMTVEFRKQMRWLDVKRMLEDEKKYGDGYREKEKRKEREPMAQRERPDKARGRQGRH